MVQEASAGSRHEFKSILTKLKNSCDFTYRFSRMRPSAFQLLESFLSYAKHLTLVSPYSVRLAAPAFINTSCLHLLRFSKKKIRRSKKVEVPAPSVYGDVTVLHLLFKKLI